MNTKGIELYQAVINNDLTKIKYFLVNGVNPNYLNEEEYMTVLEKAIALNCSEAIYLLLQAGASVNRVSYLEEDTPLALASKLGNIKLVKQLLEKGSDVNDSGFESPLYYAVEGKYIEIIKILLEAGADINFRNDEGYTALKRAAQLGYLEIVKLLVEAGADVNLGDKAHLPLYYAALEKNKDVFEHLYPLTNPNDYREWVRENVFF